MSEKPTPTEDAEMPDWQKRLIEERDQLGERLGKLTDKLKEVGGNAEDAILLLAQKTHMQSYLNILKHRVDRFTGRDKT